MNRFKIIALIQLEPRPGIPPTALHIMQVIKLMKERNSNVILIENIFESTVVEKIREHIPKLKASSLPISIGGEKNINTTEELIEKIVQTLEGMCK